MTTLQLPSVPLRAANDATLFNIWYQPWLDTTHSAIKLQRIWVVTLNDAMRHEVDFLSTMAISYSKLTTCMLGFQGWQTPVSLASCYQEITGDMAEATLTRMRKVSELNDELRERLWCEI